MKNDTFDIHVTNFGLAKAGFLFTLGAIGAKAVWATFGTKLVVRAAKKAALKGVTEVVDKAFIAFEDALYKKLETLDAEEQQQFFQTMLKIIDVPEDKEEEKDAGEEQKEE